MGTRSTSVERVIGRLAARAHGVVTRAELLAAGLTRDQIGGRVRSGLLIPVHPGVYRVGHRAPSLEATFMAAVKACGPGAVVSGLAAAYLLGLVKRPPASPEVTAFGKRRVRGVRTRRSIHIERVVVNGIPVTSVARSLADIAGRLDDYHLGKAVHDAQGRYRTTAEHVERALQRRPTSPGAGRLRRTIRGDTHVSLSALERRFLQHLRAAGLPLPDHTNQKTGRPYVDCRWIEQRLTVELDSYRFHNTRHAFEQDRHREREAYARGDDHRRYTWRDVYEDPRAMLSELRDRLLP